ncbi:uncharacterized protein LOC144088291 [Stigmatopora argus]
MNCKARCNHIHASDAHLSNPSNIADKGLGLKLPFTCFLDLYQAERNYFHWNPGIKLKPTTSDAQDNVKGCKDTLGSAAVLGLPGSLITLFLFLLSPTLLDLLLGDASHNRANHQERIEYHSASLNFYAHIAVHGGEVCLFASFRLKLLFISVSAAN